MLKNIHPLLHADLLHALASMGHGDEIVIADAHFPAASLARRLIPLHGIPAPQALAAVLSVLPLDTFVENSAHTMQVVGDAGRQPEAVRDFVAILAREGLPPPATLERHAFYERARKAFAIVATGETRTYGNIILAKGV